mgnify:FL=1
MRSWTFTVEGQPVPKGRHRTATKDRLGRPLSRPHSYTPKRTEKYEKMVGLCALAAGVRCAPAGQPVALGVWMYVKQLGVISAKDLSNVIKSAEDGMNGIAYADDRQVVMLMGVKRQDRENPRLVVRIRWLTTRSP